MKTKPINLNGPKLRRFLLGPNWRWRQADEWDKSNLNLPKGLDPLVVEAIRYRQALKSATRNIAMAMQIEDQEELARKLRLLVMAGVTTEQIAIAFGAEPHWIDVWEKMYFDVREQTQATAWLKLHVFNPLIDAGQDEYAEQLRQAQRLGPEATLIMISG